MTPRPYQLAARRAVYASWRNGHMRIVLVIPTGGGKTVIASLIILDAIARGHRVLFLAHRTELVDQACKTLHALGLHVGALAASSDWPVDRDAPVQVASIQTLVARPDVRPAADLIVADECHHLGEGAEEWSALLAAYPEARVLGLTATPERGDGTGLAPMFTDLVVGVSVRELTAGGHLVQCEITRPDTWLRAGRVRGNPLSMEPLAAYLAHGCGEQAFLYASSVERARHYAAEFSRSGVRAASIDATTPKDERGALMAAFRDGTLRVLANRHVMTEGVDVPQSAVCILATHPGTMGGYVQRVGRVLRPWGRKTRAILLDLPGSSHVFGPPEEDKVYSLDGRGMLRAGAVCRVCGQPIVEYPCATCGHEPAPPEEREGGDEILNVAMHKFARMIAQGPEQRRETFYRWVEAARLKGHKIRSVGYKWKGVYGSPVEQEPWWGGWPG